MKPIDTSALQIHANALRLALIESARLRSEREELETQLGIIIARSNGAKKAVDDAKNALCDECHWLRWNNAASTFEARE